MHKTKSTNPGWRGVAMAMRCSVCQVLNFSHWVSFSLGGKSSLGEQVDQVLLIFQRLHELLLRNASIWILLKLVEKALKIWGMIKESIKEGNIYLCLIKIRPLPLWLFLRLLWEQGVNRALL